MLGCSVLKLGDERCELLVVAVPTEGNIVERGDQPNDDRNGRIDSKQLNNLAYCLE